MLVNPMMQEVRDELDGMGVCWQGEDSEDVDEYGFVLVHVERTMFDGVEVTYAWARDDMDDDMKVGVSAGYPMYLEVRDGDTVAMAGVEDVIGMVGA